MSSTYLELGAKMHPLLGIEDTRGEMVSDERNKSHQRFRIRLGGSKHRLTLRHFLPAIMVGEAYHNKMQTDEQTDINVQASHHNWVQAANTEYYAVGKELTGSLG